MSTTTRSREALDSLRSIPLFADVNDEDLTAVASLLKTVPGVGTIAGGLLQGIVQALVTRWIGAVFIAYLANEMQTPAGGLASIARREWERITSVAELHRLVQDARARLVS